MKKIMTKPESKLNLEVYKLYPYLLKLHNGPVFSESSADFSADSFFDLYLDFLNIYIVLLYSINTFLKSDKLKDSTGRKASYFFQKDNEIKNFEKISRDLKRYIIYYKNSKSDFNKKIYFAKIKYFMIQMMPVFNVLSEYIGSFSNTYLYRNITVKGRTLSIINQSIDESLLKLVRFSHNIINNFFKTYYSCFVSLYNLTDNIYGFVDKRSCIHNANYHMGNIPESMINIDINKFFNNCTVIKLINNQVFLKTLSSFNVDSSMIKSLYFGILSLFAYLTHNSVFPTGANYTPVLSNIMFLHIDVEIKNYINFLNKKHGNNINIIYSRYADDITVSSNTQNINNTNTLDISVVRHIESILNRYGFFLNYKKTKILNKGNTKTVNGINLDLVNNSLSIGTDKKLAFRKKVISDSSCLKNDPVFIGQLSHIKNVNIKQYNYITGKK